MATVVVWGAVTAPVGAEEKLPADKTAFFESRIRPALIEHCYECHATSSEEIGGKLLLDSRSGVRRGGESGPAVVPGVTDESLILQALQYDGLEMPPDEPLPASVVRDFELWVAQGAVDPRDADAQAADKQAAGTDDANTTGPSLWSLQPIGDPDVPTVTQHTWPRNTIDRFVLAKLEPAGIAPTNDANPETLVRRLFYDLTGLPPSYDQVQKFIHDCADDRPAAINRLVDDLLARPQYGERWARHWLDVARYAESNGNDGLSRNPTFPHAWRYRDYVIDSFNDDRPFDMFITEQIAGDLLAYESAEERDRHLIATGFLAMPAKPAKAMNNNFDMDVVADQIDVIGRGILGLSIGCARCHDHKFDPIPTSDYYALAGLFTSTETMWGLAGNEKLTAPPTDLHVLLAANVCPPPEEFVETVVLRESNTGKPKKIPPSKWKPGTPLAMGVRDKQPANCKINIKGDSKKLGAPVPRGFLSAFAGVMPEKHQLADGIREQQSGRLHLANWLTDANHPLTARVIVNRVWLKLFGTGIVPTPDEFGVYGERPTHPLLLDHLATRFVQEGWSIKRLIRMIVLSRTYQLDSLASEAEIAADSTNQLLGRHNRRRLDAESIRDSILHSSGQLDLTPGEGSLVQHRNILVNLAGNLHEPSRHRSIYLCYLRNAPPPELAAFDLPNFLSVKGKRDESVVPGQALHLFNSPFVIRQAAHLSRAVMGRAVVGSAVVESDESLDDRLQHIFRSTLKRDPTRTERERAYELLAQLSVDNDADEPNVTNHDRTVSRWATLAHSLLATSEFRYVD